MLTVSLQIILKFDSDSGRRRALSEGICQCYFISHKEVFLKYNVLSHEKQVCDSEFIHTLDRGVDNTG